jgi:hypothetical protein
MFALLPCMATLGNTEQMQTDRRHHATKKEARLQSSRRRRTQGRDGHTLVLVTQGFGPGSSNEQEQHTLQISYTRCVHLYTYVSLYMHRRNDAVQKFNTIIPPFMKGYGLHRDKCPIEKCLWQLRHVICVS